MVAVEDLVFSNSKLNTYRRCPHKYDFKYVRGLERKKRVIQLERGTWIHALLEVHYKGGDWKAKHKELTKKFYQLYEEERVDLGDMPKDCLRIMRGYLRNYPDDFEKYNVIDTELDETVTLPSGLRMRVIIDVVFEEKRTGLLFAWDHKSRDKFEDAENMILDPQLTRYYAGLMILGYKPLGGVGYNEIRTKVPTIPAMTKAGHLSRNMSIDTDLYTYIKAIRDHNLDPSDYSEILQRIARRESAKFFRRTKMPKDPPMIRTMMREVHQTAKEIVNAENKHRFPRTFEKSCKWSCDFKNICIAELHGADIDPMVKMDFTTREQREKRGAKRKK